MRALTTWKAFAFSCLLMPLPAHAQGPAESWTRIEDIVLTSKWPRAGKMQEDRVTAELLRPSTGGRVPAAVIINSSGGISAQTELYYARVLASHGIAALVVDSFMPRGVRRTGDDQTRVWQIQSDADAVAAFRWLAAEPWVDSSRIFVMGMSRGGAAALHTALERQRQSLHASDIRFAAHIAIATGGCNLPPRDARTTGAPIFFMLAELDDGTPAAPCLDLARRMQAAGNRQVRMAIYPGVYHAYERIGGVARAAADETASSCQGKYLVEQGRLYERESGKPVVTRGGIRRYLMENCVTHGYTIGGDPRVKAQATADLLQFLRDVDILADPQARAVVPDCAMIPDGIHRRNCERARAGWNGDLVALGRAYRYPGGPAHDNALAAKLFKLAADRGHPQAQWELALMHRQAAGVARDLAAALELARASASAGEAPAMNILGVLARDGVGREKSEAEAADWFRKAAELGHPYALANLGRMYSRGQGGLTQDAAQAVRLYRKSAYYDNPYGQLFLAEAMEKGEGVERNPDEAIALYRKVAEQQREQGARARAAEALARLEPPRR